MKQSIILIFLLLSFFGFSQRNDRKPEQRPESGFKTDVPPHDYDLILCRPTDKSITVSILFYQNAEVYLVYFHDNKHPEKSETMKLTAGKPVDIKLTDLQSNCRYRYCLLYKTAGNKDFKKSKIYHFRTGRAKTDSYCFTLTADSHLDENTDTQVYSGTMLNAAIDSADFHIDLGDTFMTDKYRENYKNAVNQYIAQRYYFSLLQSPLFLVLGNHDGEAGQRLNESEDNMTVWSNLNRKRYFPNPEPNDFYCGNSQPEKYVGFPQDYYSWKWGNALFIVLDPFWFTARSGNEIPWDRTLGKRQFDWLKATLAGSGAMFKFVFIHNLVGGADVKGKARGGAEIAGLYEWGGQNPDGSDGFKTHRPYWEMPIHDLLRKYKVTAVFHGHDHLFARQEKDGIIYQCLSQPGSQRTSISNQASEYGYTTEDAFLNPGYLRVRVQPAKVLFEFVGTNISNKSGNKKVVYSYQLQK